MGRTGLRRDAHSRSASAVVEPWAAKDWTRGEGFWEAPSGQARERRRSDAVPVVARRLASGSDDGVEAGRAIEPAGFSGGGAQGPGPGLWASRALPSAPTSPRALLDAIFALPTDSAFRSLSGRATLAWPADPRIVVKRYARGDWRDAWRDWRAAGHVRSAGRREAENLVALAALGVPTPRALGWCGTDGLRAPRERSAMWMERVEHTATLREQLERDPLAAERWLERLAQYAARLHATGWRHRDFYLQHWLVTEGGLVLIDVGRCEREIDMHVRWFVKDIASLEHSCPAGVAPRTRLKFLARYLDLRGLESRAARRRFARAVIAKARRIAAHAPRHVDLRASHGGPS